MRRVPWPCNGSNQAGGRTARLTGSREVSMNAGHSHSWAPEEVGSVGELLAIAERSQTIRVPASQLWTLLSGPQMWSAQPNRFAFDVTVPPSTRLRVVLGVNRSLPVIGTYEIEDEAPGLAMAMRARVLGAERVISVSAVPDGDSAVATITIRARGQRAGVGRGRWLARWLADLREVAEGRAPYPGPGMPESLWARCLPAARLRRPVTASASALIAAPPTAVWDAVYAPESAVTAQAQTVAAGVVPGTPAGRAGELRYFVTREAGGWFSTQVMAVTELGPGRSVRATTITFPRFETLHLITPQAQGTRLELTFCWPGNIPGGKSKSHARAMADAAQHSADGYRDLIENQGPRPLAR